MITITHKALVNLGACDEGLARFRKGRRIACWLNRPVSIRDLLCGANTLSDFRWLLDAMIDQVKEHDSEAYEEFKVVIMETLEEMNFENQSIRVHLALYRNYMKSFNPMNSIYKIIRLVTKDIASPHIAENIEERTIFKIIIDLEKYTGINFK
ncbi:MAG: hypothetical protein ACRCWQ_02765 [Bacilli bacterium]